MRMLMQVILPIEPFNSFVKDGTAGQKINRILEDTKPEAVYFTDYGGQRGAIMVIDMKDPSKVPFYSEPWFITFDADVEFHIVMSPEDLGKAGLDKLGKKWS